MLGWSGLGVEWWWSGSGSGNVVAWSGVVAVVWWSSCNVTTGNLTQSELSAAAKLRPLNFQLCIATACLNRRPEQNAVTANPRFSPQISAVPFLRPPVHDSQNSLFGVLQAKTVSVAR